MSFNRDLQIILKHLRAIHQKNLQADHDVVSAHDNQVLSLRVQNFLRRNRPQIILGSAGVIQLAFLITGIFLVSQVFHNDKLKSEQVAIYMGIGTSLALLGTLSAIVTLIESASYCYRNSFFLLKSIAPMDELNLPVLNHVEKNKILDHFTTEQTEKLIRLCLHLTDAIAAKSDFTHTDLMLFFPKGCSAINVDDTLKNRVNKLKYRLDFKDVFNALEQFQKLDDKLISEKSRFLIQTSINACLLFCRSYKEAVEASPLLSIKNG